MPPTTSIQKIGFRLPAGAECRGSADTHNHEFTTVNSYLFQSGSKKCSPSFGTTVHNKLELLFTLARNTHPPSSGGFRSTVSLSARVGSADSHSSFGGFAAKRQGMPTVLSAPARTLIFKPGDQIFSNGSRGLRQLLLLQGLRYRSVRGSVTHRDTCVPLAPFNQNVPHTLQDSDPVSGKKQNIGILGMRFPLFCVLIHGVHTPNKRLATRKRVQLWLTLCLGYLMKSMRNSLPILAVRFTISPASFARIGMTSKNP